MSAPFKFQFGGEAGSVRGLASRLAERAKNPRAALEEIGAYIVASVRQNFVSNSTRDALSVYPVNYLVHGQKRGGHGRWAPRLKDRKRALVPSSRLAQSITHRVISRSRLAVGSPLVYAHRQHTWRPFLILQRTDIAAVTRIARDFILANPRRGEGSRRKSGSRRGGGT